MEPISEGFSPRRKKGTVQKQPMLTVRLSESARLKITKFFHVKFSSVEHHPMQTLNVSGLLGDLDEY